MSAYGILIQITKIKEYIGAEVRGVDLRQP